MSSEFANCKKSNLRIFFLLIRSKLARSSTCYHITIHLSIRFGPTLSFLFNHLLRNEYLSYCGLLLKRFCGSMGSHRSARFVRTCPNLATDSNSQTQRYLQFRACASSRVRGRKGNINAKSWHKWPAGQCGRLGGELF